MASPAPTTHVTVQWRNWFVDDVFQYEQGLWNDVWSGPLRAGKDGIHWLLITLEGTKEVVLKGEQAPELRTMTPPTIQWRNHVFSSIDFAREEGLFHNVWTGPLTRVGTDSIYYSLSISGGGSVIVLKGAQEAELRTT